jgi:hypothetical protein
MFSFSISGWFLADRGAILHLLEVVWWSFFWRCWTGLSLFKPLILNF